MRLIDTHVHLHMSAFDEDREAVFARAAQADVQRMINIGYDLPSSAASIGLARQYPQVYATAGIQPHYANTTSQTDLAQLVELLSMPKVVALGEIGLDYHHDRAPRPLQRELFVAQLQLAAERQLPVVIHSREASEDTVRVLAEAAHPFPVVMHSFSGNWEYATRCLELGAYLSFSGPLTFPKATDLHDVAVRTPLDRVLIETDCPYLSPHPHRGRRNEPARVRLVCERLAALRGEPLEVIAQSIWHNASTVFRF